MVTIRAASPDDAAAMAELRWEFRSNKTPPTETRESFVPRCAAWMRDELACGTWRAWLAVADGRIIGQLWLQVFSKLPNPAEERERHAYVSNVYVTPGSRGGVGTMMLQTAIEWAKANDIDRVVLWPTARSRTLYQRFGFSVTGNVLELTL